MGIYVDVQIIQNLCRFSVVQYSTQWVSENFFTVALYMPSQCSVHAPSTMCHFSVHIIYVHVLSRREELLSEIHSTAAEGKKMLLKRTGVIASLPRKGRIEPFLGFTGIKTIWLL